MRRTFTEKRAAAVLAAALILIPGVPIVAADALASSSEDPVADGPVTLESLEGRAVVITPPAGWTVHDRGSSVSFASGASFVAVDVYDRNGRDLGALSERLLRQGRLFGVSGAPDGGDASAAAGALHGGTCVLTSQQATGHCALVADDDVVVFVQSLGTPAAPALPLSEVLSTLQKEPT